MEKCSICSSTVDFVCSCKPPAVYFCYKHCLPHYSHPELKFIPSNCKPPAVYFCYKHCLPHYSHPELKFIPSNFSLSKASDVIKTLENKKQQIYLCIEQIQQTTAKIIKDIEALLLDSMKKLIKGTQEIDKSIIGLKKLTKDNEINFLGVHSFLFDEEFLNKEIIEYSDNYLKAKGSLLNLFTLKVLTKRLLNPAYKKNEDFDYYRNEFGRLSIINDLKSIKKNSPDKSKWAFTMKLNESKDFIYSLNLNKQSNIKHFLKECSVLKLWTKKLYEVRVRNVQLSNSDLMEATLCLACIPKIKTLEFYSSISVGQMQSFSGFLSKKSSVKYLYLGGNIFCDKGIEALCKALVNLYNLQSLDLSDNFIEVSGAQLLAKALQNTPFLRYLNLNNNKLGYPGTKLLCEALRNLRILEELHLSNNLIQTEGIREVMISVYTHSHLYVLDLSKNEIFDEGGLIIANYLPHMQYLHYLKIDLMLSTEVKQTLSKVTTKCCKIKSIGVDSKAVIKKRNIDGCILF
ncbi:hypothetical protein SteCoe_14792 [Stentor coeruleus]|uniref:Uncharacterized protein n=1 Tax=Stentor coeruleus TaxID=5963 RepID=A0A1R2C581_9CILI|nr:hypothetical protein SteCoe_14792 [Stentor coeruleus]